jgi:hypothetical protein
VREEKRKSSDPGGCFEFWWARRPPSLSYGCASRGPADLKTVGLTRRGPPTCRHRREWLRLSESAKGRVQPPGEPVNVRRTVGTKGDVPTFLGLHVLISFACALGESAPPFMGSADHGGSALPLPFKNQNSTNINRQFFLCHAAGDKSAGRGGPALPAVLNSGGRDDHPP